MVLATDKNDVDNHFLFYQFFPLQLQIVFWQPATAEFIEKEKVVHFFVNASDISSVKAHLNESRIPFR